MLSRGFRSPRVLVEAYRRPQPPYGAGPHAARAGATALIDVSDGLIADAGHIARASGVSINLDPAALPVAEELRAAASAFNLDPMSWVLSGGDDHALLATFAAAEDVPAEFRIIGRTEEEGDAPVLLGGHPWAGESGHEHFR